MKVRNSLPTASRDPASAQVDMRPPPADIDEPVGSTDNGVVEETKWPVDAYDAYEIDNAVTESPHGPGWPLRLQHA